MKFTSHFHQFKALEVLEMCALTPQERIAWGCGDRYLQMVVPAGCDKDFIMVRVVLKSKYSGGMAHHRLIW